MKIKKELDIELDIELDVYEISNKMDFDEFLLMVEYRFCYSFDCYEFQDVLFESDLFKKMVKQYFESGYKI